MDKMSLLQDLLADVKNLQYKGSYSRIKERGTMIAEKVFGNDSEYIKKIQAIRFLPSIYVIGPKRNIDNNDFGCFESGKKNYIDLVNIMIENLSLEELIEKTVNIDTNILNEISEIEKLAEDYSQKRAKKYTTELLKISFSKWQKAMQEFLLKHFGKDDQNYKLVKQFTTDKFTSTLSDYFDKFQPTFTEICFQMKNGDNNSTKVINTIPKTKKVFIVHGHDEEMKQKVHDYMKELGLQPIILSEQAAGSLTIIEKFENEAKKACFAIVLLSPCDQGRKTGTKKWNCRARQNVVFEYGYFVARLGRERVVALQKNDVELPTDISGMIYRKWDDKWQDALKKELKKAKMI